MPTASHELADPHDTPYSTLTNAPRGLTVLCTEKPDPPEPSPNVTCEPVES
jgi:hypothetical protein